MKILKKLSIFGLIIYLVVLALSFFTSIILFSTPDKQDNYILLGFICLILILYSIFYIIIGCIKGYKNKKASLIITSIIGCVIYGIYFFIFILFLIYNNNNEYTRQEQIIGMFFTFIPIAIIFNIIILIISLKMIKKNNI